MLGPLCFHPLLKETVWGGQALAALGKKLPAGKKIGESWEVAAHPNGQSVIANGPLAGQTLQAACQLLGQDLLGTLAGTSTRFPLLIKLIDAQDRLSVQVHPGDTYAARHEQGGSGKSELWLVLAARPGARLVAGLKTGTSRQHFEDALTSDSCLDQLNQLPVQAGDVLNIPHGLVHAIGRGIVVCEIQQNADTTYRLFDYGRTDDQGRPRPLQVKKALDVIRFDLPPPALLKGLALESGDLTRWVLVANRYFLVEQLDLRGQHTFEEDGSRFKCLTVLKGAGLLTATRAGKSWQLALSQGQSILLPAALSHWALNGRLSLVSTAPADVAQDRAMLTKQLRQAAIGPFKSAENPLEEAVRLGFLAVDP